MNGPARFDGMRFKVLDKSNTPGMTSNRFMTMVRGAGDELWLASEDASVARYHEGRFETLGPDHGVPLHTVTGLTADGRGGVWIGSGDTCQEMPESAARNIRARFQSIALCDCHPVFVAPPE